VAHGVRLVLKRCDAAWMPENLHAQCGRFMPRRLHHRIPRACWRALLLRALNPRPPRPGQQALNTSQKYPQCRHTQYSPSACPSPVSPIPPPRKNTARPHPPFAPPRRHTAILSRPQHKQTPPSSNHGASCDRPTKRAAQPIASKQAIEKPVRSVPSDRDGHTRVALLCSTLSPTPSTRRSMRSGRRVPSA
jgi:hypothetical protein